MEKGMNWRDELGTWSYSVGAYGLNRVRAYTRQGAPSFQLEWSDGKKRHQYSARKLLGRPIESVREMEAVADALSSALANASRKRPRKSIGPDDIPLVIDAVAAVNEMTDKELKANRIPVDPITGVYMLLHGDEVVYVGQSTDVYSRLYGHRRNPPAIFDGVAVIEISADSLLAVEALLLNRFVPVGNSFIPAIPKEEAA